MTTTLARRKLREASYFLSEMHKRDGNVRLDQHEEFGYHLNAFLCAARSVRDALRKQNSNLFKDVHAVWLGRLDQTKRGIVEVMEKKRDAAIHEGAFGADQRTVDVDPRQAYSRHPGALAFILPWADAEGATIKVATFSVEINGVFRPAVASCQEYLGALELLVGAFEI